MKLWWEKPPIFNQPWMWIRTLFQGQIYLVSASVVTLAKTNYNLQSSTVKQDVNTDSFIFNAVQHNLQGVQSIFNESLAFTQSYTRIHWSTKN